MNEKDSRTGLEYARTLTMKTTLEHLFPRVILSIEVDDEHFLMLLLLFLRRQAILELQKLAPHLRPQSCPW